MRRKDNMGEKNANEAVSRRGFFKGTAAVVGAGLVANSKLSAAQTSALGTGAAASSHIPGYSGDGDWLGTAPVVPDSQIAKTVDVDVLVLGGGHAGVLAALGASDKKVKVAVVEAQDEAGFATDYWHRVGEDIGHVNSKWLIKQGYGPYNTGEVVAEFVKRAAGRCNPDILRLFVENSGPMFDRMCEVYESYEAKRKADDSAVQYKYSDGVQTLDLSNLMEPKHLFTQIQKDRMGKEYPVVLGGYKTWPTTAMFQGPVLRRAVSPFVSVLRWFEKYTVLKSVDNGAQWYYEHTAVVLTQDASGAVTGAIAKDKSGSYVKFNARKGVVVTTGDYANNRTMAWDLNNETMEAMERAGQSKVSSGGGGGMGGGAPEGGGPEGGAAAAGAPRGGAALAGAPAGGPGGGAGGPGAAGAPAGGGGMGGMGGGSKTASLKHEGTGHKMCCWAGGMIEPSPRGGMNIGAGINGPWGTGPMLQLNCLAKRFADESAAPLMGGACARQPAGIGCIVTDKKYVKSIVIAGLEHGGPNFGRKEWFEDMEEDMAKVLAGGAKGGKVRGITVAERNAATVIGANTLEELAGYMGYKGDLVKTFVESIIHYNELCKKGVDSDYGKDVKALIPIDEPPFYGCSGRYGGGASFGMVTMSGMVTDTKLRVLDKKNNPIKGLYVAGNTLGGRYGLGYSTPFAGNSIGMAMTHGWLAGQFAAES